MPLSAAASSGSGAGSMGTTWAPAVVVMAGLRWGDFGVIWAGERRAIKVIIARRMGVRKGSARRHFHRRLPDRRGPGNRLGKGCLPRARGGRRILLRDHVRRRTGQNAKGRRGFSLQSG